MPVEIRTFTTADVQAVVALSLRAWAPVFESFAAVLGESIYRRIYPDWESSQARAVEDVCTGGSYRVWVADKDGKPVGFVAIIVHDESHPEPGSGVIEMIAVDPDQQRQGIADALITFALERMREDGVQLAVVGTGGDPGHLPARRAYEKAGFTALPLVRYYMDL
jgi:ribosomal protein S18 acetylase RimI-like enzyme